ncbi:PilZ domain-containing protein [Sphingomonas floccifaciens]|uniref:PilZ domain-containing protein n=1 Tax=Sphingomonas floccifaciens TaxID=1844115 RepID=A0ABW4ND06_9SPHN
MDQPIRPLRANRTSVMLSGILHRHNRPAPTTHRVVNLSATGARLTGVEGMKVGEVVAITIGMVDNALAEVVRVEDNSVAIRFGDPIDVDQARIRRTTGTSVIPKAGWLADMQNAYHR